MPTIKPIVATFKHPYPSYLWEFQSAVDPDNTDWRALTDTNYGGYVPEDQQGKGKDTDTIYLTSPQQGRDEAWFRCIAFAPDGTKFDQSTEVFIAIGPLEWTVDLTAVTKTVEGTPPAPPSTYEYYHSFATQDIGTWLHTRYPEDDEGVRTPGAATAVQDDGSVVKYEPNIPAFEGSKGLQAEPSLLNPLSFTEETDDGTGPWKVSNSGVPDEVASYPASGNPVTTVTTPEGIEGPVGHFFVGHRYRGVRQTLSRSPHAEGTKIRPSAWIKLISLVGFSGTDSFQIRNASTANGQLKIPFVNIPLNEWVFISEETAVLPPLNGTVEAAFKSAGADQIYFYTGDGSDIPGETTFEMYFWGASYTNTDAATSYYPIYENLNAYGESRAATDIKQGFAGTGILPPLGVKENIAGQFKASLRFPSTVPTDVTPFTEPRKLFTVGDDYDGVVCTILYDTLTLTKYVAGAVVDTLTGTVPPYDIWDEADIRYKIGTTGNALWLDGNPVATSAESAPFSTFVASMIIEPGDTTVSDWRMHTGPIDDSTILGWDGAPPATAAAGNIYYLDTQLGNNGNDGSQGSPFATTAYAGDIAEPGDTIRVVARADGDPTRLLIDTVKSGTAAAPITWESADPASPTVLTSARKVEGGDWTSQGGGVYTLSTTANPVNVMVEVKISDGSEVWLVPATSAAVAPGEHYYDDVADLIYYSPTAGTPADYVVWRGDGNGGVRHRYDYNIFNNFEIFATGSASVRFQGNDTTDTTTTGANYCVSKNINVRYSSAGALFTADTPPYNQAVGSVLYNVHISYVRDGIYIYPGARDCLVQMSSVAYAGTEPWYPNVSGIDRLAVGVGGGGGNVNITGNRFEWCESASSGGFNGDGGITLYYAPNTIIKNCRSHDQFARGFSVISSAESVISNCMFENNGWRNKDWPVTNPAPQSPQSPDEGTCRGMVGGIMLEKTGDFTIHNTTIRDNYGTKGDAWSTTDDTPRAGGLDIRDFDGSTPNATITLKGNLIYTNTTDSDVDPGPAGAYNFVRQIGQPQPADSVTLVWDPIEADQVGDGLDPRA